MTEKVKAENGNTKAKTAGNETKARLAEALRANLARRKAQARARQREDDVSADDAPADPASLSPESTLKG